MSSIEDSEDEFESADEDFESNTGPHFHIKNDYTDNKSGNKTDDKIKELISGQKYVENLPLDCCQSSPKPSIEIQSQEKEEVVAEVTAEETAISDEKLIKQLIDNKETEEKTIIKGRKILRKADRIEKQTTDDNINDKDNQKGYQLLTQFDNQLNLKTKDNENQSIVSFKQTEEETSLDFSKPLLQTQETNIVSDLKTEEIIISDNKLISDDTNVKIADNGTQELVIENKILDKTEENKEKEEKTLIKGRKLLRKADRLREQTTNEESLISEEKKTEVLNKLSNLGESEDTSSNWNNWFTDIKSAAKTATSTTVSHVSQASNKWSFGPKSLLSSAVTITSHVGSGLSSVVDNVTSVVDSAIGAPPPEQMAALVNKDSKVEEISNSNKQNTKLEDTPNKSGFGFGLFDYTLNTLESIGKKTIEVIVDDKPKQRHSEDRHKSDKLD